MSLMDDLTEEEQRHYWRLSWLSSLQSFADETAQARKWTDSAQSNPHFSFIECMCCYFDDAGLSDQDSYNGRIARGYLSSVEADAVAEFHLSAEQYQAPGGDDYDDKAILDDPAWRIVMEAAQRAQARLLPLLGDPFEVAALTKPLVWENTGHGFKASYPDPA